MPTPTQQPSGPKPIRAYACWPKNQPDWKRRINAASPGKARSEYWRSVSDCWPDTKYTDIRCECVGGPWTSTEFQNMAAYRGIPFAYCGMRVEVEGKPGVIVGHNSSANLDVLFDGGVVLNCHPTWCVRYFDAGGKLIGEFNQRGEWRTA